MKKSPVVHFEMPYKDAKRVSKFYESVFGWGMQYFPEMGNYVLAATTDTDEKTQRPKEPGAINGGFFPTDPSYGNGHIVISVENLKKYIELIKNAGGKVIGEPKDIPGVGLFVMIKDTEDNEVGGLQPAEM